MDSSLRIAGVGRIALSTGPAYKIVLDDCRTRARASAISALREGVAAEPAAWIVSKTNWSLRNACAV